ncbi:MAG: YdcH family protein [Magnetococcales bacterium]|nr:YdcH family protein [Magnetococcales bacterium]MBF0262250.1 YdcH family protein [Magnetococcales bacterium]
MFEDQLQAVNELLKINTKFRELYDQHEALRNEIDETRHTRNPFDIEKLKKEKLRIKDLMAVMLAEHTASA